MTFWDGFEKRALGAVGIAGAAGGAGGPGGPGGPGLGAYYSSMMHPVAPIRPRGVPINTAYFKYEPKKKLEQESSR